MSAAGYGSSGPGGRYLYCPDCGKRGVSKRLNSGGDHWGCRYCEFFAYDSGEMNDDRVARRRLAEANPEDDIWVTDLAEDAAT